MCPRAALCAHFLFLIYIHDLPTVIKHSRVALYADDAVVYCYSSNRADLKSALSDNLLLAFANWLNDNKLTLDVAKTKSMLTSSDFKSIVYWCLFVALVKLRVWRVLNI